MKKITIQVEIVVDVMEPNFCYDKLADVKVELDLNRTFPVLDGKTIGRCISFETANVY